MGIEFGKKYLINIENGISTVGRSAIIKHVYLLLVNVYSKQDSICCELCFSRNFSDWKFAPVTVKGEDYSGYYGKLTTRISKLCNDLYGIKLSAKELANLGDLITNYSMECSQITIDFTPKIDWQDGDFGDKGSCFWRKRKLAPKMLMANQAFAMRMWQDDIGVGRAWMWQHPSGAYILWNGYGGIKSENGNHSEVESKNFAATLADILHNQSEPADVVKIQLRNNRKWDEGLLWINNGIGYLVGDKTAFINYNNQSLDYDFGWSEYTWECWHCKQLKHWDNEQCVLDDKTYCHYCYTDIFYCCEVCAKIVLRSNIQTRYTLNGRYNICADCNEHLIECQDCHYLVSPKDTIEVKLNNKPARVCRAHKGYYSQCLTCGILVKSRKIARYEIYKIKAHSRYSDGNYFDIAVDNFCYCSDTCKENANEINKPTTKVCPSCAANTNYILSDGRCPRCSVMSYSSLAELQLAGLI